MTIQDVFEAVGAHAAGPDDRRGACTSSSRVACPGAGACGGQFTANTMALVIDFLGISPARPLGHPGRRTDASRRRGSRAPGELVMDARPRRHPAVADPHARRARERDRRQSPATGGSTNGVLHLLAIAREAGIALELDDFDRSSAPHADRRRPEAGRPLRRDRPPRGRRRRPRRCASSSGAGARRTATRATVDGQTLARGRRDDVAETPGQDVVVSVASSRSSRPAASRSCAATLAPEGSRREARRPRAHSITRPGARLRLRGGVLRRGQGRARSSRATWS